MVNRITNDKKELSMTGHIVVAIRGMLREFPVVNVSHVNRINNKPAHVSAKIALSSVGRSV